MSDVSSGARSPDITPGYVDPTTPVTPAYPAETYPATETYVAVENYPATEASTGADDSRAKQVAQQSAQAAGQAASDVKDTAKEQALRVGGEAKTQIRNVASDARAKVGEQARSQNDKLVGGIRQVAEELDKMRGDRQDSPAAAVVSRVADGGRQMADYLDRNGPEGVLREVQDFARRRPGAFLATALAAGFVVGRLGKGVMKADDTSSTGSAKPSSDSFSSTPDSFGTAGAGYQPSTEYATSTEYASTGTGTPVAVEQEFLPRDPGGTR